MTGLVKLVGIGNYVELESGVAENRLFIELPSGKRIEAVISDVDLLSVTSELTSEQQPSTRVVQSRPPPDLHSVKEENGQTVYEFGGSPTPIPPTPMPKRKSRLVGKDSAGNPIVEVDGIDPSTVTGSNGEKDEDGVSQL